jgi:hypothetical protein
MRTNNFSSKEKIMTKNNKIKDYLVELELEIMFLIDVDDRESMK